MDSEMWVKFNRDFSWTVPPTRRVDVFFRAGGTYPVRRICGEEAIAAGAAEEVKRDGADNYAGNGEPQEAASEDAGGDEARRQDSDGEGR